MKDLFSVEGKVIVITGATGIIGRELVKHFAEQGAKVVVLGRATEVGEKLVAEVKAEGGEAMFLECNVLDKSKLEKNYEDIMAAYGRIDVLINGAGGNQAAATVAPDKTIFDLDIEAVRQVVELGSHDMFIADVVGIEADERYIDPETGKFSLDKAHPIVYSHGEYFTLGKLIGHFGWSVRKKRTKLKR